MAATAIGRMEAEDADGSSPSESRSAPPWWLGMRVWLALVFALVVGLSAGGAAYVFLERFDDAFRSHAQELAAGYTFDAAMQIAQADADGAPLDEAVGRAAFAPLFVFDGEGKLVTDPRSQGVPVGSVPQLDRALASALEGRRFLEPVGESGTVVGLPIGAGEARALVAYSRHPDLGVGLGLAREKIVEAALVGFAGGALAGCLVAWLLGRRLGGIAECAADIERGDFDREISPTFRDEVGALAATIDRMRQRLRESFAALGSARDRLDRLLERLHEGVLAVDRDLSVEFANPAARSLLGRDLTVGARLPDPWTPFSLRAFAATLFEEGASVRHERVAVDDERTLLVVGIPADSGDGAVLVVEDVSVQERRERAEREFVSNAAHELRTPLQTIIGAVEALEAGAKDDPDDRDRFLGHIRREGARLARLTRALLVLARAQTREEPVRLGSIELGPLLHEICAQTRPRDGVGVDVACPPGLAVAGDRDLVEQAIANVVTNAAKHTASGRIAVTAAARPGAVAIDVEDTGPGIAPDRQERVFDRFYRGDVRAADGFGLGLALVREAVRALDGHVELESTLGEGTRVRVVLPRSREEVE